MTSAHGTRIAEHDVGACDTEESERKSTRSELGAATPATNNGDCDERGMLPITVKSAMTNEDKFGKIEIYRGAGTAGMLRRRRRPSWWWWWT